MSCMNFRVLGDGDENGEWVVGPTAISGGRALLSLLEGSMELFKCLLATSCSGGMERETKLFLQRRGRDKEVACK